MAGLLVAGILLLGASGAGRAADPFLPRFNGVEVAAEVPLDLRALRDRLRQRPQADDPLGLTARSSTGRPAPIEQSLRLHGVLGGQLGLRFESGGFRLPDFAALRSGVADPYGRAPGSRRMELTAKGLALGHGATLGAEWLQFGGRAGSGQRLALALDTGRLKLNSLLQELDPGVQLGVHVAPGDRKFFGKEEGLERRSLDLQYQAGARETLSFADLRLSGRSGEAQQRRIAFTGRNDLHLTYETGQVAPGFDRAGSLPEAEKKLFSRERGFRWQEMALRLRTGKIGLLDASLYRARSEEDNRERTRRRFQWNLTPSRTAKLLLARDESTQQERAGDERESTTHLVQWDQALGNGMALRAARETTDYAAGGEERTRTRHLLSLQSRPRAPLQWSVEREMIDDPAGDAGTLKLALGSTLFRVWTLQGNYAHATKARTPGQTNYQLSLTGTPAKGWQVGVTTVQRALGGGAAASRKTLSLTGTHGVLGGVFRKTRLALDLTSLDGSPMALVHMTSHPRPARSGTRSAGWDAAGLQLETPLGKSLLALGVQRYDLPAGPVEAVNYWWRSAAKGPLEWEARRNWLELPSGQLVPRERYAFCYRRGQTRLTLARELNPEPSPGKPLIGQEQTTVELQTQVGTTKLGLTIGETEDWLKEAETVLRRFTIDTPLSPRGSFHFAIEDNQTPAPTPAIPHDRLELALRQEFAPDRRIDLQAELRRWRGRKIKDELTWRLDLLAMF